MTLKKKKTSSRKVHIHLLNVPPEFEEKEPSKAEIIQLLSNEEQKRYNRYLVKRKKVEFYLARKFAKNLISARLNIPNHAIKLQPDSSGKPFLFLDNKPIPLYFNISHTSGFITCVISKYKHTGIDVEYATGSRDNILQRFFHSREINEYMNLSQQQKDQRFYILWTLKEAYLKAIGSGLHTPLDSFWFSVTDHHKTQSATIHFDDQHTPGTNFHFLHFQPTPEHFLAVAVKNNAKVQFITHLHSMNDE